MFQMIIKLFHKMTSLSQVSIEDANKKKRMVDFAAVAG
jgi:hypothetical protein